MPEELPTVVLYAGDHSEMYWPPYEFLDANDAPLDLTAYEWKAQWRRDTSSASAVELTVDETAAASGVLTIVATGVQTALMAGWGVWDLQSTKSGKELTWFVGNVLCSRDVTRDE